MDLVDKSRSVYTADDYVFFFLGLFELRLFSDVLSSSFFLIFFAAF